ncbi:MAG: aconitase X catalytic domain-containing protein [Chloroflexi bacterium]|nr:aconitase X catalytic domain-containing protein [Chloroflexota bacterium]MBU1747607.1 aconitase X catalytic domain-containing protein [Chloroflexota bacterium]
MQLTDDERAMLDGARGPATAKAMRILVTLGDIFGAERLVPVSSAQISGVSYKTVGDAGLEFLTGFGDEGARVVAPAFLNPCGMDLQRWREMGVPETFADKQLCIIAAYERMGVALTATCTPYLAGIVPAPGEHVAWAESSAVSYANSVLGARTNRESGISALAAAICGRTPAWGLHLDENRTASLVVEVRAPLLDAADFGALGVHVGRLAGGRIPAFTSIPAAGADQLKALGAAMAASGSVALYFVEGITPEWRLAAEPDRLVVNEADLDAVRRALNTTDAPELVALGCPHCSVDELRAIADRVQHGLGGRRLWVCTSRAVAGDPAAAEAIAAIEAAGGHVLCDTCMVVAPIEEMGIARTATNSGKAATYLPTLGRQAVMFGSLDEIL